MTNERRQRSRRSGAFITSFPLELIATDHARPDEAWTGSAVPADAAICGFHSATLSEDGKHGRSGSGTVHHIAWRTADDAQQLAWREMLVERGYNVSPVMDRTYFHSIYYREPGGILFEIATDPPGFAFDELPDHLGERLMLPPQVEHHRSTLEQALPRLTLPHQKSEVAP